MKVTRLDILNFPASLKAEMQKCIKEIEEKTLQRTTMRNFVVSAVVDKIRAERARFKRPTDA